MSYQKFCQITPEEYQDAIELLSRNYAVYGTDNALPTYALGLGGEVGEVQELLKRGFRGDPMPDNFHDSISKELGDVVAQVVLLCNCFGISFEDVLVANIDKLQKRVADGTLLGLGSDR